MSELTEVPAERSRVHYAGQDWLLWDCPACGRHNGLVAEHYAHGVLPVCPCGRRVTLKEVEAG